MGFGDGNDFWDNGLEQSGSDSSASDGDIWSDADDIEDTGSFEETFEEAPSMQQSGYAGNVTESQVPRIPVKFVGIALAGVILVVALIFAVIDGIKVKPKAPSSNATSQQVVQESTGVPASTVSNSADISLIYVPESTTMNYSGDVYEATGTVTSKDKYVQNHQVIYCVQIKLAVGSSTEVVNFYCNYAAYNAVKTGDLVLVKYQQVSDSFISVNEVTK